MRYNRLICLFLSTIICMVMIGCGEKKEESKTIIRPVRYQQVYSKGSGRIRTFSGSARAGQHSRLSFKVAGTVKRVLVSVGDRVDVGDLLAELDPKDYALKVQQAEAALDQGKAQARNAEVNYERVRGLYESENASRNDLDDARTAYESASAAVRSTEKQYELAKLQRSYTKLIAPSDCAIAEVNIEVNENVSPGSQVLAMTSGTRPEVTVAVPEILISDINEGDNVSVIFDAIPSREFTATVIEVGIASTGLVTTFPVTVRIDKADSEIRPGMAAEASFTFEATGGENRFIVPPFAVSEDLDGRFVYLVEPAGTERGVIHRREVTVGELTRDGLEILNGLVDGELLVTAGISKLSEGLEVRLLSAREKRQ
jgi:RND family efflux transporter MFP subunit